MGILKNGDLLISDRHDIISNVLLYYLSWVPWALGQYLQLNTSPKSSSNLPGVKKSVFQNVWFKIQNCKSYVSYVVFLVYIQVNLRKSDELYNFVIIQSKKIFFKC